jgi:hypothetical protein
LISFAAFIIIFSLFLFFYFILNIAVFRGEGVGQWLKDA